MATLSASSFNFDMVIYVDEKASSTNGGPFNATGTFITRTLNTTIYSRQTGTDWASLGSNQITLQPGTYYVEASAPAYMVSRNQAQFYNVTDASTQITGTSAYSISTGAYGSCRSFMIGEFTITGTKTFDIRHRCQNSNATNGFGVAVTWGNNYFTIIKIINKSKLPQISVPAFNYDMVIYVDQKASNGGSFSSGGWRTRELNTTLYSKQKGTGWASLSSDQITLQPGTYFIEASAPAIHVDQHQVRIYNNTDATSVQAGTTEYSGSGGLYATTRSYVMAVVTITASKVFEIQHRCITSYADGFGLGLGFNTCYFTVIQITKLS